VVEFIGDAAAALGEQSAFRAGAVVGDAAQVVPAAVAFFGGGWLGGLFHYAIMFNHCGDVTFFP
jgi:hypothetical protein